MREALVLERCPLRSENAEEFSRVRLKVFGNDNLANKFTAVVAAFQKDTI